MTIPINTLQKQLTELSNKERTLRHKIERTQAEHIAVLRRIADKKEQIHNALARR